MSAGVRNNKVWIMVCYAEKAAYRTRAAAKSRDRCRVLSLLGIGLFMRSCDIEVLQGG